jgi:hypothetical protein
MALLSYISFINKSAFNFVKRVADVVSSKESQYEVPIFSCLISFAYLTFSTIKDRNPIFPKGYLRYAGY